MTFQVAIHHRITLMKMTLMII